MIVEREEEIERFEKREYWTIEADLAHGGVEFAAKLVRLEGAKVEQFHPSPTKRMPSGPGPGWRDSARRGMARRRRM